MPQRRATRFIMLGLFVSLSSLGVQQLALHWGLSPTTAAYLRLTYCLFPIYAGFSRFVLREVWLHERQTFGSTRAELMMMGRVLSSVGASVLLKAIIEPPLTVALLERYGAVGAAVSALAGDYTYGPLATYVVLTLTSARATSAAQLASSQRASD